MNAPTEKVLAEMAKALESLTETERERVLADLTAVRPRLKKVPGKVQAAAPAKVQPIIVTRVTWVEDTPPAT